VISVPPALLTTIDEKAEPLSAMAPLPAAAPRTPRPPASPTAPAAPGPQDATDLPQRRRRNRTMPVPDERPALEGQPPDPEQARMDWEDFEQAVASGRSDTTTDTTTDAGTDTEDNT
jgi:hypothetical protein